MPNNRAFRQNLLPPFSDKPASSSFFKEIGMRVLVTIVAAGAFVATTAIAAVSGLALATSAIAVAAERPSFEMKSFPASPVQVTVLGAPEVREQAPSAKLTFGGMPASPAQIAILTPRPQMVASSSSATR
jgi:hypothetical protein